LVQSSDEFINSVVKQNGEAIVVMYTGRNILKNKPFAEIVTMIVNAKGTKGTCVSYIENVAAELRKANINDPVLSENSIRPRFAS
jgi:cation transport regulator ChaC